MTAFLVERFQETEALDHLASGEPIEIRTTLSIRMPDDSIERFVADRAPLTIGSWDFAPVPMAEAATIVDAGPDVASNMRFRLAPETAFDDPVTVDAALASVAATDLTNLAVCVGRAVFNDDTGALVGLEAYYPGFVSKVIHAPTLEDRSLYLEIASFDAWAHNLPPRYYSDGEHQLRHSGDRSRKWLNDVVWRNGQSTWNGKPGSGAPASGGSFGGGNGAGASRFGRISLF